ncbi:AI-2E family transporter [Priestia megaterium]|uniref:AI-2E family transporter n=1 Tax=Priestia megaterium TaxID=1404 RepID=UPI000BF40D39|nr:AI-2E family transporter [Priestia megaterium]PFQ84471.1 AI-2E family transporter [Priestia megaterium]UYT87899.1 AI-2E family transporter [Priestia megaterium]
MKDSSFKWFYRFGLLLLALLCILVFFKVQFLWLPVIYMFLKALLPFFIAAFITYLLHPLIEKTHDKGVPRPLAILLIYIIFFGGIGFGAYKSYPIFVEQVKDLNEQLPHFTNTYRHWVESIHDRTTSLPNGVHEKIEGSIDDVEATLNVWLTKVAEGLKSLITSFLILIIIPFIVFYMLKDFSSIKKATAYVTPKKWHKTGERFLSDVNESLGNYIRGQFFVCLIIGVIATAALWFFHVPYALLLGFIIGVTNIIPYFGPIIGAVPAAIIAATISIKLVITIVIIIFVLQFLEGNVLSPLIVGKSLHIHPLFIMLALLLGGEFGGVLGLILAVPILAVIKISILHIRSYTLKH